MNKRDTSTIELSIIIVNWNSKDYLRKCLTSVFDSTHAINYEIIVVDSASYDGCAQMLDECFPQVRFIQSHQNIGFGRSNNLGAKHAKGEVLLFLNPDTEVVGQAIEQLYFVLQKVSKPGVVGCRLLNSDKTLQANCVKPLPTILNQVLDTNFLQCFFKESRLWESARKYEGSSLPVEVDVISGACMMIPKDVFTLVKGFSAEYFMYSEDVDLCFKTLMAKYCNYYFISAEIIHHGGSSTQQQHSRFSAVMVSESKSRLLRKMRGSYYSLGYRVALTMSAVVRIFLLLMAYPVALIKSKQDAWLWSFKKWTAKLRWGFGLEQWVYQYDQINCSGDDYTITNG